MASTSAACSASALGTPKCWNTRAENSLNFSIGYGVVSLNSLMMILPDKSGREAMLDHESCRRSRLRMYDRPTRNGTMLLRTGSMLSD